MPNSVETSKVVRGSRRRTKLNHPTVGELTLDFESLELPGDPGQTITTYTAEPGSPSQERLELLASWTAPDGTESQRTAEGQRSTE